MIARNKTQAVAYLRRSTDRQEQSIGDQRKEIRRWADQHGYDVVREYVDDAISGTSADARPAFQKMIAEAKGGDFSAVIVWNSDRFSRGDVTETEHYRYLLRKAGAQVLSVTEDYLGREGIDGDVLRTVKQFQNRQFSISLSQNTLRGQISSVAAASDPGRPAPYGYDREILAPDGVVLYRVRFCPDRAREVYNKDGQLQARYAKGQSLRKPGKECKARLVLSDPQRVQAVKDIFAWCLDGVGFKGIADRLNARGLPSPRGDLWGFTTVKAILGNPAYRGDMVWNRRTEAKFYTVKDRRADRMRPSNESARIQHLGKDDWIVIADAVPALVDRQAWEQAQGAVKKRSTYKGGAGKQTNRWLLSGVLRCGDCGHPYWGELKRKKHIEGRKDIATKYYTCAGRRTHGNIVCTGSSHIQADALEDWVLAKLKGLVFADNECVDNAIDRFVAAAMGHQGDSGDVEKIAREIQEIDATVNALTMNIDPANLAMLNDRLTQFRRRKEHLSDEFRTASAANPQLDEDALRRWTAERIQGLADALDGRRDENMRRVVAAYVEQIVATPSTKTGFLALTPAAYGLYKQNDRPEGRSWVNMVAGAGFEPATFGL